MEIVRAFFSSRAHPPFVSVFFCFVLFFFLSIRFWKTDPGRRQVVYFDKCAENGPACSCSITSATATRDCLFFPAGAGGFALATSKAFNETRFGSSSFSVQKTAPVREPEGVQMSAPTAVCLSPPPSLTSLYVEPHRRATKQSTHVQEKERKDAVGLPTVGNALTVSDDVAINLLRYTIFMQSAGKKTRGAEDLSARNEFNSCRSSRWSRVCTHLSSISVRAY